MLHILIGEDDYSVRQALEEIKKSIGDPAALLANTTLLEGRQVTPEQLRSACETVPFLGDRRLVVIEGLLERFEDRQKNGRKKSSRQTGQPAEYRTMSEGIKRLPPFTELVIIGSGIKTSNPLLRELLSVAKVRNFPLLRGVQLSQWIEHHVARQAKGAGISPPAAKLIAAFVGSDLWAISNEVDKLIVYTGGRRIEEEDVKAVVSYAREADIFAMIDAVIESRVGSAQQLLQRLFQQGMAPAQVLVMLARQVRIIFLLKDMRDRGKSRGEIQNRLGLKKDFVFNKAWAQADKYSPARIKEVYHRLLETDLSIKTGKYDSTELALEVLLAELGQRWAMTT